VGIFSMSRPLFHSPVNCRSTVPRIEWDGAMKLVKQAGPLASCIKAKYSKCKGQDRRRRRRRALLGLVGIRVKGPVDDAARPT
jgi:hypothetical protein